MGGAQIPAGAGAPRGLLITHGHLGVELKRTAEIILGTSDGIEAVSNTALSGPDLAARVNELAAAAPRRGPLFLFVDLIGSSCAQAAADLLARPDVRLFCGVNLPMVLAFLQYRTTLDPEALAAAIVERAHRGIVVLPAPAPAGGGAS